MKKHLSIVMIAILALSSYACKSDKNKADEKPDEIVGTWISEGAGNVAFGLAYLAKTKKITATFNNNQTYHVVSVDSSDVAVTFEGTWTAGEQEDGQIRSIVLNQTVPTTLTSEGIFQVVENNMTYEVIQTEPALDGVLAPTVGGGFGSTNIGGTPNAFYIQKYTRSAN